MGRYWLIALAVSVQLPLVRAAQVSFVDGGKSDYVIGIGDLNGPTEKLAAEEVAKYIKQMSGAELPIQRFKKDARRQIGILMISSAPQTPDAAVVLVQGENINIGGTTTWGLMHACYVFLDQLGCRFLAPQFNHYQGSAEIVPATTTLTFDGATKRPRKPALKFRKLYVEEGHSHDIANLKQLAEWMPKAGYNTLVVPTDYQGSGRVKWDNWRVELTPELQKRGIIIEVGGHGYQNFLNAEMEDGRLFEQHPEWFGKNKEGKPQKAKGWVCCTSNPEPVNYLIKNFVAYVKERPEIQIYDFWPPDGAKWCECAECAKLGTPSDRQAILVAQVKEAAKKVRPDLRLEVLAYHTSVMPPHRVKLDPEILLDFCPISQQFDVQINDASSAKNKEYVDGVSAWRKAFDGDISIYTYYRKYAWDSLPVIIPHYMQKDLQWYATLPVQGVSVYSEPGDWFTYELNHYVLAALAWDANADVDALIDKFCQARYGEFAAAAGSILVTLEDLTRMTCSVPHVPLKDAAAIKADRERATDLVGIARAAAARAKDAGAKHNLGRLALMCEYAQRDLEVQHMRATNADIEAMRAKATALHAWASEHKDEGVFLIKNHRLNVNRMLTRLGIAEKKR